MQAISLINGKVQFEIGTAQFREHVANALLRADALLAEAEGELQKTIDYVHAHGDDEGCLIVDDELSVVRARKRITSLKEIEATMNMVAADTFAATNDFVEPVMVLSLEQQLVAAAS